MNEKMKLLCVLLSILFLTMPLGIAAFTPIGSTTFTADTVPAAEYDFSNRRSPISILMYTEKTDLSAGGEFENTLESILETYGPAFQYENLTDYTDLSSMINAFDVFLILEQEVDDENFTTIGASWAGILTDFVSSGGIVISLDGGSTPSDWGAKILNATGLIRTSNVQLINPTTVSVVDDADALAFGVTTTFATSDASFAYNVLDGTVIVEHDSTSKAFAVHRSMGDGHVVLIGADFFSRTTDMDILLANAIRLTRHAVFDNSHDQLYNPLIGYNDFAHYISQNYGFAITTMNIWDESIVEICDVLVAGSGGYSPISYSSGEITFIKNFVAGGGGLFLFSDWGQWGNNTNSLLGGFGFARNYTGGYVTDTDDYTNSIGQVIYSSGNIANHSATIGVSSIQMYLGNAFTTMPVGAKAIVWTDTDGTSQWSLGGLASELPVAASLNYGAGRIFALADCNLFNDDDNDADASHDFFDEGNEIFAADIMNWLSAAGIREKTILVEQSHNPFFNTNGLIEFFNFLTLNGFNIRWTNSFSEILINEADVIINIAGTANYTTSEKTVFNNFISHGGGLFLLSDWTSYHVQTNDLLSDYGMVINGTSYLTDLDDGWVDGSPGSYIAYGVENMGSHPIMNNVRRIEVDRSPGFSSIGVGTPLVSTDDDGTASWFAGGIANELPVFAATTYNFGRVVVVPDINFLSIGNPDGDYYPTLYDSDNDVFLTNTFFWLIQNRAPIVEVVYPNGGELLNGTHSIEWNAVDPNIHDHLTFQILVSDNNGSDWTSLVTGISGLSYDWNTTLHDDGIGYMIRVIASDGLATGQDQSDNPFELDNFIEGGGGGGLPIDPMLLLLIGAGVVIIVIVIIIFMKKKK